MNVDIIYLYCVINIFYKINSIFAWRIKYLFKLLYIEITLIVCLFLSQNIHK